MSQGDAGHSEIIIIKRSVSEEEGHHGGAWKIAFADFMTAMMALFLVLWLINAANEETKRAVASYFNPVKLVDRNRSTKGVNDQQGGPTSKSSPSNAQGLQSHEVKPSENETVENDDAAAQGVDQAAFFKSPYEVIDAILLEAKIEMTVPSIALGSASEKINSGFEDPFTPATASSSPEKTENKPLPPEAAPSNKDYKNPSDDHSTPVSAEDSIDVKNEQPDQTEAISKIRSDIRKSLEENSERAAEINDMIEMSIDEKGILISVTDQLQAPMFAVGSAVPEPPLVLAMEAISSALRSRPGLVHIYGHTDAREYKDNKLGNWNLSSDRAQATYFMLTHGGLEDARIAEITAFADRKLRKQDAPFDAANRRIEILLANP